MRINWKFQLHLLLFPILELVNIILAFFNWQSTNYYASIIFVLIAAVFMNFSLHISFHYKVHHPSQNKWIEMFNGFVITALLGLPYRYYQFTHWNHHKHNNSINDFSTTWANQNDTFKRRNFWLYTIFWWYSPKFTLFKQFEIGTKEGYYTRQTQRFFVLELISNSFLLVYLIFYNWQLIIIYYLIIYIGWSFIAAHNYGQHLPVEYMGRKGYSYLNSVYNILFLNNGLHEEHHEKPGLNYWELKSMNISNSQKYPPLIDPILFKTKK